MPADNNLEVVDPPLNSLTSEDLRELKNILQLWKFGRWVVYIVLAAGSLTAVLASGWHAFFPSPK